MPRTQHGGAAASGVDPEHMHVAPSFRSRQCSLQDTAQEFQVYFTFHAFFSSKGHHVTSIGSPGRTCMQSQGGG